MALTSLGDMAHTFMMRRQTTEMKKSAQGAATEMITGRTPDTAAHLRGNLVPLTGIEASLTRLQGYRAVTQEMTVTTAAMQTVLATVDELAAGITPLLLNIGMTNGLKTTDSLLADAGQQFSAAISALNTRLGDRSLFSGVASDQPALAGADTMLTALEGAITVAGATTATQIEAAVTGWFNDPAGFATLGYLGGDPAAAISLSPEDKAGQLPTADTPALRATLRGLAMAALLNRSSLALPDGTRQDLARRAGEALLQGQNDLAGLAGGLGVTEGRVASAAARNQAETATLEQARGGLLATDPYEAATRMEAAQSQLETLYAVTARLSRLSLVDFLR